MAESDEEPMGALAGLADQMSEHFAAQRGEVNPVQLELDRINAMMMDLNEMETTLKLLAGAEKPKEAWKEVEAAREEELPPIVLDQVKSKKPVAGGSYDSTMTSFEAEMACLDVPDTVAY